MAPSSCFSPVELPHFPGGGEFTGWRTGEWSGFEIRSRPELASRRSNPKLHYKPVFASGPLILTLAKEACRNPMRMLESDHLPSGCNILSRATCRKLDDREFLFGHLLQSRVTDRFGQPVRRRGRAAE
jgi:hypothetical protein